MGCEKKPRAGVAPPAAPSCPVVPALVAFAETTAASQGENCSRPRCSRVPGSAGTNPTRAEPAEPIAKRLGAAAPRLGTGTPRSPPKAPAGRGFLAPARGAEEHRSKGKGVSDGERPEEEPDDNPLLPGLRRAPVFARSSARLSDGVQAGSGGANSPVVAGRRVKVCTNVSSDAGEPKPSPAPRRFYCSGASGPCVLLPFQTQSCADVRGGPGSSSVTDSQQRRCNRSSSLRRLGAGGLKAGGYQMLPALGQIKP